MERPLKSDGLDDMDELRQAFTKRVIPPALEERLLGSEKLRRDLLGLATEDEAYLFIRKADMSSQLRSQLLVESPVISTNKTTSRPTPTPRPATKDDGTNQSLQSSRHSYLTRLPGSQVASNSSFATSTLTHITHKCETPNLLAKDKLPTKDSTSVAPVKRIFTAKRTFPPYSIPKSNLTKKLPELVGNKTVISASSISPGPTRIVSDILQVPIGIRLLLNTSNQKEDVKNPLATNQTIPQQLYNGRLNDPHIPDEQEKDLKRKRDTPSSGVSWDSHPQKSRKGNSTNTPSETLDAASSKTHSKNELSPANRKRSRLKASQELRSKDVDGLAESAHGHTEDSAYNPTSSSNNVSNDIESSKVDAINSRVPNTDVASNTNPNSLASHRRLLIDENSDEIDDDILLRKLNIPAKATKPDWNYHIWTFPSGETQATSGALLPRGYTLHDHPDAPWICPIRSCRVLFSKLDGLGAHFNRAHRASLINDNEDGTLSIIQRVEAIGVAMPAEVVSHKPLDPKEPLREPSLNFHLRQSKAAALSFSQAGDSKDGLKKTPRLSRTLSASSLLSTEGPTREDGLKISSRRKNLKPEASLEQVAKLATRNSQKEESFTPRGSLPSPRQPSIASTTQDGARIGSRAHMHTINPAHALELETWEIAPGRIRDGQSETIDNFAFSNSYLTQNQAVRIGRDISFQVITIKPGTVHFWSSSANNLRLCSVASGKLQVSIHDQDFSMGPNGMIRIRPGVECTAKNRLYIDATIHVTTVPGDLCGRV